MRISDWSSDVCSSDLPACLIKFLPGVSVTHPTPAQARAAGAALAQLHRSLADFTLERHNGLGPDEWPRLMRRCGDALDSIAPALEARLDTALADVLGPWPEGLARSAIHADLVPVNALRRGDRSAERLVGQECVSRG